MYKNCTRQPEMIMMEGTSRKDYTEPNKVN